jgi:hypothetical protein
VTGIIRRPHRRKAVLGAALLAPLALLGARRAMRAAAVRRETATVRPAAAVATSAPVGASPASVEPASDGRPAPVSVDEPVSVEAPRSVKRPWRKGRTLRLALAAASVALLGVFIQHAQSRVPRPTLVVESPTKVTPATPARPSSVELAQSTAAAVHARRRGGVRVPAPTVATPSRRRPTQPVLPAKHASEHAVSPVEIIGGSALDGLRWNAVAGAAYYNLVFWHNGKRVLDLWPTSPYVLVPTTSVKQGSPARLSPGRYLWFAYPGFGSKQARQYGALAGTGVLVVQPKGGK